MGKEYAYMIFNDYVEELIDGGDCKLYGVSFDSFLLLAIEMDILKVKDQYQFLTPLNMDKQYSDMVA